MGFNTLNLKNEHILINNPSCYLLKIGSKQVKNSLAKSKMTLFLYKNLAFFILTLVLNE